MIRRAVAVLAAVALLAVLVVFLRSTADADALDWMTAEELELASWIQGERAWNGVDVGDPLAMVLDGHLTDQAQKHAARLAACGCPIFHSPPAEFAWWQQRGWRWMGENVATADTPWGAHAALMRSPGHLANILEPSWRGYGVAIRRDAAGRVYVAEVFGAF